ncbi:pyridoxal phosphate-dependent decarboxylase family protein [Pseudomarimonas arenosa]|uniref:pyridoxal phosphate-dependent decarboxylase family protein n=1 Tax=Pseudomarimonas arenosa TaxID=2774145 RepID=UPI002FC2BEA4
MTDSSLFPCFLGPYGENDNLLEKLVVEFLRDHVYWRRNLHPEDPPAIPTHAAQQPGFQAFESKLRRELHQLSAALKRSVPFHSQRYLGHMVSDLLIPGMAAQILTLPYNPNNVSDEAAPVTIDMEIEVGLQLARMIGYPSDPNQPACAFGHLTSGGTVANYQALRLALAIKAYPVALLAAAPPDLALPESDWAAFNLAPQQAIEHFVQAQAWMHSLPVAEARLWRQRIEVERIEQVGQVGFFARHPELRPPVVLVPATAHYSWSKGMKLLGLGRHQLLQVPEREMRLDADALERLLMELHAQRQPVLACVGILGSTEFGTVDPIDQLCAARDRWSQQGFGFAVHADAAWGGYLATLIRDPNGALRSREQVSREFARFPNPPTYSALAALQHTDSITIDPHKLGYLPYGAGAFVARDQRPFALLAESADYVFQESDHSDYFSRARALGQYIIEGSKSGAMAAAVCVTHRVMPLDHAHFGRLPAATIQATEHMRDAVAALREKLQGIARLVLPFEPDCNLICLAINPQGNRSLERCNRFMRQLHCEIRSDNGVARQDREYYGCVTTIRSDALGGEAMQGLLQQLGLDCGSPDEIERQDTRLIVLRHTLMNPFLIDEVNDRNYLDGYFEFLQRRVKALAGALQSADCRVTEDLSPLKPYATSARQAS